MEKNGGDEMEVQEVPADRTILGVNDRSYPCQGSPWGYVSGYVDVTVVLVAGQIGDYAAYVGIGSPDYVKQHGNKISFEEACIHFPMGQLERERYRD